MDIHLLDIILYFVIGIIIWNSLSVDYTEEIGGLIGIGVLLLYTIVYIVIFGVFDINWIDIFSWVKIKLNFKW